MTAPSAAAKPLRVAPGGAPAETEPVDPSKLLDGIPSQTTENHYEAADGRFFAGLWSSDPGAWRVDYSEHELCQLLEGEVELTAEDGSSERFAAGEAFVIPAGFKGTWRSIGKVRKLYAIYQA